MRTPKIYTVILDLAWTGAEFDWRDFVPPLTKDQSQAATRMLRAQGRIRTVAKGALGRYGYPERFRAG